MKKLLLASLACLCLLTPWSGCAQLSEQRITVRYDQASDTLRFLVLYDGVQDSGDKNHGEGAAQLAALVANREILIADWPFHLQPDAIKRELAAPKADVPQPVRDFGQSLLDNLKIEILGYHRDARGRIGGVQMVTITKASAVVAKANTAINFYWNEARAQGTGPFGSPDHPGMKAKIDAAVGRNHAWFGFDGQALRVSVPVHRREWAQIKADALFDAFSQIIEDNARKSEAQRQDVRFDLSRFLRGFAGVPVSYIETGDMVTVRVGDPQGPSTFRIAVRETYQANLEKQVIELGKVDLDAALAKRALGLGGGDDAGLRELQDWGPPEQLVCAVVRAAESKDAALSDPAFNWLRAYSAKWTQEHNIPEMPSDAGNREQFLEGCKAWARQMAQFPTARKAPASRAADEAKDAPKDAGQVEQKQP